MYEPNSRKVSRVEDLIKIFLIGSAFLPVAAAQRDTPGCFRYVIVLGRQAVDRIMNLSALPPLQFSTISNEDLAQVASAIENMPEATLVEARRVAMSSGFHFAFYAILISAIFSTWHPNIILIGIASSSALGFVHEVAREAANQAEL